MKRHRPSHLRLLRTSMRFIALLSFLLLCIPKTSWTAEPWSIRAFSLLDDGLSRSGETTAGHEPDEVRSLGFLADIAGDGDIVAIRLQNLTTGTKWESTDEGGAARLIVREEGGSILNERGNVQTSAFDTPAKLEIWVRDQAALLSHNVVYQLTIVYENGFSASERLNIPRRFADGSGADIPHDESAAFGQLRRDAAANTPLTEWPSRDDDFDADGALAQLRKDVEADEARRAAEATEPAISDVQVAPPDAMPMHEGPTAVGAPLPSGPAELRILEAVYEGREERRIDGLRLIYFHRAKPETRYLVTRVRLAGRGTVDRIRLGNRSAAWDTVVQKDRPTLLIVQPADGTGMYNREDGTVKIPVEGEIALDLLVPADRRWALPAIPTTLRVYFDGAKETGMGVARPAATDAEAPPGSTELEATEPIEGKMPEDETTRDDRPPHSPPPSR